MSRKFSSEMDEFVQGLALEIVQGFFLFSPEIYSGIHPGVPSWGQIWEFKK